MVAFKQYLESSLGSDGYQVRDLCKKKNSNLVGYVCNIPNNKFFEEIVQNTTLLSDSFKANGVLIETIEILELVET